MTASALKERECLVVERMGRVVLVQFNRPRFGNGLNSVMVSELAAVAGEIDADPDVRCVVLTGTGTCFSVGGDIKEMAALGDAASAGVKKLANDAHKAVSTFARMRAPLVVAVNGMAAGGGFSLAMAGDMVLASESASFTMAYSAAGLSPDGSSTYFMPRLIGLRKTQELMFTNRRLSAHEALAWNLIHRVTADDALRSEALALAERIAQSAVGSNAAIKSLLLSSFENGLETQMEMEARQIAACVESADGREGIRAFCAKRAPVFG
ncbi:MAG: enoyl-CoA hydratase/isomerase family protein [Burkholderiales bacterium]